MPQLGVKLTVSGAQRREKGSKGCAPSSCARQALPELGASSEASVVELWSKEISVCLV